MKGPGTVIFLRSILRSCRRKASLVLIAFMLGMSNAILEETRMINDTREHLEQQEIEPEDDGLDASVPYES
ncbi:hypothetical protein [Spongiimicrobium sp. 2-473A-2-J]|uniref:hypothetical protein n=1 Tax=Eudoraea algarum TaxID=3417568 RepID=UPI003D368C41